MRPGKQREPEQGQELCSINKLGMGRPHNLRTAGSALTVGGAHLRGCGHRRAVRQGTLSPSIWQRGALKDTVFLLGVHPPLQTCPVLRYHYSALGDPLLQVAGLFHQRPTLHSKKVPFLTLNKSPNLSFVNKTEILPPTPCDCNTEIKCSKCLTNYSFCN